MNKKDYLDRLSAEARPVKPANKASRLLSSKIFLVCAVGLILLVLIMIVGSILGSSKTDKKTVAYTLALHLDNTGEVIKKYQPSVKSSLLRSTSASLGSVLSDTYSKLNGYLTENYKLETKDLDKKMVEEATLHKDGLDADLFEAKINGMLDKVYANKMVYEITLIMTEETQLNKKAGGDEVLTGILTTSYDSLSKLYDEFNNFAEAN